MRIVLERSDFYRVLCLALLLSLGMGCAISEPHRIHPSEKADETAFGELEQAKALIKGGDVAKARPILEDLLERHPDFFRAKKCLQEVLILELGEPGAAQKALEDLELRRDPMNLTLMARVTKNSKEAANLLLEAIELDETYVWAHFGLAFLLLKENNASQYERAQKYLEDALKYSTDFDPARRLYIELLHRLGDSDGQEKQYRIYLKKNPEDLDMRYNYADFLRLKKQNHQEALQQLELVLNQKPDRIDAILLKGVVLRLLKRYEEARVVFEFLSSIHPNALLNLAFLYKDCLKKPDLALECFEKFLRYKGPYEEDKSFIDEMILAPNYIETLKKDLQ